MATARKLSRFGDECSERTFCFTFSFFVNVWTKHSRWHMSKRPQTKFASRSKGKHNSTIVRWITHELIPWTLLSVDSLVTTKHKKCVFQFSENWAFLCPIKPILREGKLLWSLLIRTNDRCCKQAEGFNSDLRHWFASAANYCGGPRLCIQCTGKMIFFVHLLLFCKMLN